jgi:hypothetical protein
MCRYKKRKIRNAFEHFDEKLDEWASGSDSKPFVDLNIGPRVMIVGMDPEDHLRFFDTENISINFKGDTFKVQKILEAIYKLKKRVNENLSNLMEEL